MTIGMIAAVSPDGVIGLHGKIPWHYRADMQRFKRVTMGAAIVMGRLTWESMPKKPLPGRRNVVITSVPIEGVETFRDIPSALAAIRSSERDVWFIGGARIYQEAMRFSDTIDLTYVPDRIEHPDAVRFPPIDESEWEGGPIVSLEDDPILKRRIYRRR
jgi:dihydrofolate reductase